MNTKRCGNNLHLFIFSESFESNKNPIKITKFSLPNFGINIEYSIKM